MTYSCQYQGYSFERDRIEELRKHWGFFRVSPVKDVDDGLLDDRVLIRLRDGAIGVDFLAESILSQSASKEE